MQLAKYETVRSRSNGKKSGDNVVVRCLFEVINRYHPTCHQSTHDVIDMLLLEASRFKLGSRQKIFTYTATDCVRYGWNVGISGKPVGKVTFPEKAGRRWAVLFKRAIACGINIARAQLTCLKQ